MDYINLIDPEASAAAGSSVSLPEYTGSSMDFSSMFGSLFDLSGSPFDTSKMNDLMNSYINMVRENTNYNNAWSAEQAEKMMDFQRSEREYAEMFNQAEAAKNRDWQEMMSNTAHQREIADLKAAGLNPVLSARGGNGASVGSGATAAASSPGHGAQGNPDQSANSAITGILGTAFSAMTNLSAQLVNAQTSLSVASKYTEMERIIEQMREEYGKWEHANYPDNLFETISAVLSGFGFENGKGNLSSAAGNFLESLKNSFGVSPSSNYHSGSGFTGSSGKIDSKSSFWQRFIDFISDNSELDKNGRPHFNW